jgi:hypothetical protein
MDLQWLNRVVKNTADNEIYGLRPSERRTALSKQRQSTRVVCEADLESYYREKRERLSLLSRRMQ